MRHPGWDLAAVAVLLLPALVHAEDYQILERGRSAAGGVLVNMTGGARTNRPIDPSRPTLVVVHGINMFHPYWHYTVAERYAEVVAGRYGGTVNVLGWDWNADTLPGLWPPRVDRHAVEQGKALGQALLNAGVDPSRAQVLGQSEGCVVATSAVREMRDRTGRAAGRLTLIDPAWGQHNLLFVELGATSAAAQVQHFWVRSTSGFGREAHYPGVLNTKIDGKSGLRGYLKLSHLDHYNALRWHLDEIAAGR